MKSMRIHLAIVMFLCGNLNVFVLIPMEPKFIYLALFCYISCGLELYKYNKGQ